MDKNRIDSYLRFISSVLNFDVGEVWTVRKIHNNISFTFQHLYTSSKYIDKHNILLRPEINDNNVESNHCFSPIICRSVCDGNNNGQIVWVNYTPPINDIGGLIGKTDLPLNTALGIPVCNVGDELCIFVLFATEHLHITPNIVEFLINVTKACSGNISSTTVNNILPICKSHNLAPIDTNQFIGLWDLNKLMEKYGHHVKFNMLSFNEFDDDYGNSYLDNILKNFKYTKEQQKKITNNNNSSASTINRGRSRSDSLDDWKNCKSINEEHFAEFQLLTTNICFDNDDSVSSGTLSNSNSSSNISNLSIGSTSEDDHDFMQVKKYKSGNPPLSQSVLINAFTSYMTHKNRFHEFVMSFLGISSFDCAELWFRTNDENKSLSVAAAVYTVKDNTRTSWLQSCEHLTLNPGQDTAGVVMVTNQPYWDVNYAKKYHCNNTNEVNSDYTHPRAKLAAEIGLQTSFGIPMIGPNGCYGAIVFYSRSRVEPDIFINTLTTQGALILSTASLNQKLVESFDNESLAHTPGVMLFNWMERESAVYRNNSQLLGQSCLDPRLLHDQSRGIQSQLIRRLNGDNFSSAITIDTTSNESSNSTRSTLRRSVETKSKVFEDDYHESNARAKEKVYKRKTYSKDGCTCIVEDCERKAVKRSPYCSQHSGNRRCHFEGCTKCAQGSTKFCIAHGGGRRCTFPGCSKGARDKSFCAAHGGGKRCVVDACTKSAVGGSKLCTAHGGGKRCQMEGCDKASQSSTLYCVRHGGGRKCREEGCRKVARGRTDFCAAHAGNNTNLSQNDGEDG